MQAGGTGSAGLGSGGMASKVDAARIATGAGVPVLLGAAAQVLDVLEGRTGTCFHADRHAGPAPAGSGWPTRRRRRGRLLLDDGAVRAVVERGSSLLPAGITAVQGEFAAGDPVELVRRRRASASARGLVAYDAAELPALLGRSTRELGLREVVHRDDLVLLPR